MQEDNVKSRTFSNSTGQTIVQIYTPLDFVLPGKIYESPVVDRKYQHSILHYVKQLLIYLLSSKIKQILSTVTLQPKRTLQSVYSQESMAILSNSFDLDDALFRAKEYNIPLLQVVILTEKGEKVFKDKVLLNFKVAHLINENFVLYGDWEARPELFKALLKESIEEGQMMKEEGIYVRMGELVYAFIPMIRIDTAEDQLIEENLLRVRNIYYQLQEHSQSTFSNLQSGLQSNIQSNIQASPSMFGPQSSYNEGQAFNDSDEEIPESG